MAAAALANVAVGCQVTLETTLEPTPISGEVFAYDPVSSTLALRQPGSAPFNARVRLIRDSAITRVVSATPPTAPVATDLPYVDPAKLADREEKAVAFAEAEALKIGIGVTREAQEVFDALAKTMPCRWDGQVVVVLDEVTISPPYTLAACAAANPDDTKTMDRVKKVLEAERARMGV